MNYISPMELTTLLNKTKHSVSKLSLTEHRFLTFLLAFVNGAKIPTNGYLAWPGIDTIIDYTGMGDTTIQKIRKTLVTTGWMQYTPGKGPNNSNHYYINAQKIVDCAMQSGNASSGKAVANTVMMDKEDKKQVRNTSGLVQNRVEPKKIVLPAKSLPILGESFDEDEAPF